MEDDFEVEKAFDEGDTNEVFLTEEGTIVKEFSRLSVPGVTISVAYLLAGRPRFFTRSERMKNEREIRQYDLDSIEFPQLIREEGSFMEFEYIQGENLREKALNSPKDAEEIGETLGRILEETRKNDLHLVDWFLENFIENEEGLYHVDPEYADLKDSEVSDLKDILSIMLTLKLLPPENCSKALEGFRSEVDARGLKLSVLANFVTLLYAFTLGSREQKVNSIKNLKK